MDFIDIPLDEQIENLARRLVRATRSGKEPQIERVLDIATRFTIEDEVSDRAAAILAKESEDV